MPLHSPGIPINEYRSGGDKRVQMPREKAAAGRGRRKLRREKSRTSRRERVVEVDDGLCCRSGRGRFNCKEDDKTGNAALQLLMLAPLWPVGESRL